MSDHNQVLQTEQYEEPEGLDQENDDLELEEYPLDSVLIRSEYRTVSDIIRRIRARRFILDPDFQRDFVWDEVRQSRLIESVLMRIPLPVFYLAENDDGMTVVVDGLQRLTTFSRYLADKFALRGLEKTNPQLEGKRFRDLGPKLQNRLEDVQLILYLIDSKVPERAKLDIFERVNSGLPLTRQQMRNSLFMGQATRWLKAQADSKWFLEATTGSLNPKTMRDRELINRFCGFYLLGVQAYRGDMDAFLAETLKHMNTMEGSELANLGQIFQASMKNNYTIFKKYAFRKHTNQQQRRSVINAALFDVLSVQMTKYDDDFIKRKKKVIQKIFYGLIDDEKFSKAITYSTNSLRNAKFRFKEVELAFRQV